MNSLYEYSRYPKQIVIFQVAIHDGLTRSDDATDRKPCQGNPQSFGRRSSMLGYGEIRSNGFESWSSQTNDLMMYTCHFPNHADGIIGIQQTGWLTVRVM